MRARETMVGQDDCLTTGAAKLGIEEIQEARMTQQRPAKRQVEPFG
jgi:hypothetical protein